MPDFLSLHALFALAQVILIDITLAGDNAIVVGLAVRGLPEDQKRKAIMAGVAAAAIIRLLLALIATKLLLVIGLRLAGGLLLLWVCWHMFRELRGGQDHQEAEADDKAPPAGLRSVIGRIILADLSMSLDNVLAVAGAAAEHTWVLVSGLAISVILMAVAATLIARLLERYPWISWLGLIVVFAVALELIIRGGSEVLHHVPV
ncbi:YjbE family putative metal transport protein [Acetobacter sp. AN02]|uniref:YjbE family putative metal transport protein n=1 Tax=Acetobacter sp. AN02 TaxID=2894186 RepID=UPI0024345E44|nr:YjbE family putative metal transport protein [Acetobacter sp. AN02]MDG6094700.1 YjbE family putative metal transport protein [Acetobacter sp. AN02]